MHTSGSVYTYKHRLLSYEHIHEQHVQAPTSEKVPSDEQLKAIKMIVERCLQERSEEQQELEYRSEPLRLILHGVPGAGKTATLLWIRNFFEEVCGWTHGVQFVFLASQNTMAALILGFTLHSYHKLPFMQRDGTTVAAHKDKDKDLSSKFMCYQTLRWMFVDELSTVSLDICAEIDNNTSTHIRERGTWCKQWTTYHDMKR